MSREYVFLTAAILAILVPVSITVPSEGASFCNDCYQWFDEVTNLFDAQCCVTGEECYLSGQKKYSNVNCEISWERYVGWRCDADPALCDYEVNPSGGEGSGSCTQSSTGWCPPSCASCN